MGYALCRFHEDQGCNEMGSQEWYVCLEDVNRILNVPSMWKHYMVNHLIQPTAQEREVIMASDPLKATGESIWHARGIARPPELKVLYVERTGPNKYTHEVGTKPDLEFINKLEEILKGIAPLQTKGLGK